MKKQEVEVERKDEPVTPLAFAVAFSCLIVVVRLMGMVDNATTWTCIIMAILTCCLMPAPGQNTKR
jgi:hypothetical protein